MAEPAVLLRRCREALRLSQAGLAAALHVSGARTVQKWEAGERAVPGPVWVALRYMMTGARQDALADAIDALLRRREAA